jgi:maltose/moltooligosaccharide transporter
MSLQSESSATFKVGSLLYTRRGLFALFAWMLWGDVCFTLMESVVPSIMPLKLGNLGASNTLIGILMTTVPGILNVTITPWLSFKSDRHRSRWGRRLPFILSTAPFLAGALILMAFSDNLGTWAHGRFFAGGDIHQAQVVLILLSIFAALYNLFNMFVNTVFWYLFVDVVPETHLARFNAYFKVVGAISGAAYNFFIFKYAETHMREIFLGAAFLYLFGFGLMCLRVKEGEYPPVTDVNKQMGMLDKIRVFGKECFTIRYYWDIFLWLTFQCIAGSVGVYGVFFMKSLGVSLDQMGKMSAVGVLTGPLCLLLLAGRVDRWHPIRVTAYTLAWSAFFAFGNWIWLFVMHPPPLVFFWLAFADSVIFSALFSAAGQAAGGPVLMFLFPHSKYGQFSGAMALIRAVAIILAGVLAGMFMDFWKHLFPEGNYCYRFMFLWSGVCNVVSFYFFYRVYRVWKRMGGVTGFVPPETNVRLADLPPRPDATSGLHPWMVRFSAIAFGGGVLGTCVWISYWTIYDPRPDYVRCYVVALVTGVAIYIAYLRFMKYMERP